jgi:threonine aldolase
VSDTVKRQFASDNYAGICPDAMGAIERANAGFELAYGDDGYTARASELLRELFETDCDVYFVFNGTAANSLALAALCQSYHSVIVHELAHVETDECGAPEFFSNGTKLLTVPGADGKMDPGAIERTITKRSDIHYPKPRVISLTQSTELGSVYSIDELQEIHRIAHRYRMRIHMDGARFANAVAALGCRPSEITWRVGVDVLCFGGTKNGMPVGEAILFFDRALSSEFSYRCKQAGQLASKMRFISAPWVSMLEGGVWLANARNANTMARRLQQGLAAIDGMVVASSCQANAVFVEMPVEWSRALRARDWRFYEFIGEGHARFMCSWATTERDVDQLLEDVRQVAEQELVRARC